MHAPQADVSQPIFVPGEPELVAEEVDEQRPRLDLRLVPDAVDGERDGYQRVPPLRRAAASNLRRQCAPQK